MPADQIDADAGAPREGSLRSPELLAAGVFLLVLAAVGFFGTSGIAVGTLAEFGAGMVPRAVSVLVGFCGALLSVLAFTAHGAQLERWSLRGLACILGAVICFGLTIRGFNLGPLRIPALGLVVAGPLAVTLASLADAGTRPREIAIFAIGLTAICVGLFRFVLRLPIPVAPWFLGY